MKTKTICPPCNGHCNQGRTCPATAIAGDYGMAYRKAFLNGTDCERKQERNTTLLLIAASLYIGAHVAWYLINLLVEAA